MMSGDEKNDKICMGNIEKYRQVNVLLSFPHNDEAVKKFDLQVYYLSDLMFKGSTVSVLVFVFLPKGNINR